MFNLYESSESNVCDDCSSKKRYKVCNEMKMDCYSYKNGKLYSTCKECFNKKVRCEFCNKELNKSYLRSHIKKQHLYPQGYSQGYSHSFARVPTQGYTQVPAQGYSQGYSHSFTQVPAHTGGDLLPVQVPTQVPTLNNNNNDNYDNKCNRTLIVGPSFCGKTHLLLNKLRLIRLENPEKQIRIITRSPEQYEDIDIGGVKVEENVGDLEEYRGCCVVFDDVLDSNQKLIDPFFTRGRHKLCDVCYLCHSYFDAPKRQLEIIRI